MRTRTLFGLTLAFVGLVACGESPVDPAPLADGALAFDVVGQGSGAIVNHFDDEGLILLTMDLGSMLYSVHYTDSDQLAAFVGCAVPTYHGALKALNVQQPSGNTHVGGHGEAYAIVGDLAGFPASVCDEALAEGPIRVNVSVNIGAGNTGASFSSNGSLTWNGDGSSVRLHMSRKGLAAPVGTVRLN